MSWELRACDNMDPAAGLGSIPECSVDVVITDPPYSPKVHACSRRGASGYRKHGSAGAYADRVRELGFAPLMPEERAAMAQALARITRRWLVIFADHEGTHGWRADLEAAGLEYVRTCVWIKPGATPQLTGDRPACGHECLVIAHQTRKGKPMRKRWNGGGKQGVYWHAIAPDQDRCHLAQKPLGLLCELVADFSEPGELVCDPYAGAITDAEIVRASQPAASSLLLHVTVGLVERHCGQELFVLAPFFLHAPAYQLWHGGCHLGSYVTHLVYFEDVKTGILSIVRPQDMANADYMRFSVVQRSAGAARN